MPKPMAVSLMRKLLLIGALAFTMAIGIGSLIHAPVILEEATKNSDKLIHATAYFFFCLFWFTYLYWAGMRERKFKTVLTIAVGWSLFFGMVIEILQGELTTYRTGDFLDMVANTTGVVLAVLVLNMSKSSLNRIKENF